MHGTNMKTKIYLKYSEAVCIIQEGCTTNAINKKSDELKKTNIYLKKIILVIVTFISFYCLFIN